MVQVNLKDGYLALEDIPEGKHTIGVCNMVNKAGASIELTQDNLVDVRKMLRNAIRMQVKAPDLHVNDARYKEPYSTSGFKEEIEWTIQILRGHLHVVASYADMPETDRDMFGKLGEFLSQFEEM